ncbi:MAG TPA: hypothetical protein VFE62_25475 [Gemmataceae bacterium]|nr:hypothetical protein [Gemmataceae bacterium]
MSEDRKGRRLALSPARKMVMEVLHHAQQVPTLPLSKVVRVHALASARSSGAFVSWTALFMKAYGIVGQRNPELRRAYIRFPWPHLYEHPISECGLLVEREHEGENIVLGAKIRAPELHTLAQLDGFLRHFRETPVMEIGNYRQWLRTGRMLAPMRRLIVWTSLHLSGWKRCKRFGTFAISSLGSLGVEQHHPLALQTTYLTFGPIAANGEVTAKIIYDHRVMDGRTVARCLCDLEEVLNTSVLDELTAMIPLKPETAKKDLAPLALATGRRVPK